MLWNRCYTFKKPDRHTKKEKIRAKDHRGAKYRKLQRQAKRRIQNPHWDRWGRNSHTGNEVVKIPKPYKDQTVKYG